MVSHQWNLLEIYPLGRGESGIEGDVSWKQFAAKPPRKRGARRSRGPLGAALHCGILVLEKPLNMQEPQASEATGRQSSALLQVLPTPCTDKANDEAAGNRNYIKGRDPFLQRWQKR